MTASHDVNQRGERGTITSALFSTRATRWCMETEAIADAVICGLMAGGTTNSGEESTVPSTSSSTVPEATWDQHTSGKMETGLTDETLNLIGLQRKLLAVETELLKEKIRCRKLRVKEKRKQLTTTDEAEGMKKSAATTNKTQRRTRSKTRSPVPR